MFVSMPPDHEVFLLGKGMERKGKKDALYEEVRGSNARMQK